MANRLDMGEYALVDRFYVVKPIERLRKVERVQSLSLVEHGERHF